MSNRNQPCQCSSGLKYKKCCGSPAALKAARAAKRQKEMDEKLEAIRAKSLERKTTVPAGSAGLTMAILSSMAYYPNHDRRRKY